MQAEQTEAFPDLLARSGLTARQAAAEFDVSLRTIQRYANGEVRVPAMVLKNLSSKIVRLQRPAKKAGPAFTFIDLFAGIGGLRLGFEAIGGKCVFTSEWDKYAQQTYRANFSDGPDHQFAGDIRPYGANPSLIPAFDVLLAGFPCQPFSLAGVSKKNALGRPHGFDCDKQGTLFFEIERIIKHHRPAAFLLENVKNLERHDKGQTFAVIKDTLENELGYKLEYRVISSHPWVPQKRERIFMVGFREDCGFSFDGFDKRTPPQSEWPVLGDIMQSHNEVGQKYTLTAHLWQYLQDYREKHEKAGHGFGYSMFGKNGVTRTLSARYYKDGSEILIEQKGTRPRRLTPIECARLMGFERGDRTWNIPVSDTQAYKQFGNSVVVPVVEAVARHMQPAIRKAVAGKPKLRKQMELFVANG
ncbi:MAG: DNA (cytosine-5-)-methyltransferase [Hyphomonadaceae bacterium]|nr:DNA (cytosine-5-)-methyltransferase [Hyphomonadaceae bacterium]